MSEQKGPTTSLCRHGRDFVEYRGRDLVSEVLPQGDFVAVAFRQILGREPSAADLRVVHAVLVVLMEHGLTPSATASRLVYMSAPENLQGAVAAGLMAVGSQFVGTTENCARLLERLVALPATERDAEAARIVAEHAEAGLRVPGFGHHLHRPEDPRAAALLALADELALPGDRVDALRRLSQAVDAARGRHVTINATGAVAALLGEIDVPVDLMRGFAVISRAAGLVAHIAEEQRKPAGRRIWEIVDAGIPYEAE